MNLYKYRGFAVDKSDHSYESMRLLQLSSLRDNIDLIHIDSLVEDCPKTHVPCGSVEWCLRSLGKKVEPNYYPDWCADFLYRKIWKSNRIPVGSHVFIKPFANYKTFTGIIATGTESLKMDKWADAADTPVWCSDVVSFVNEWRYYITNGTVVDTGWYAGDDTNTPNAPDMPIKIPSSWSGTIDMGTLSTGELAVVECHHPFACGMYSKNDEAYFQWLIDGWRYMNEL